MQAPQPTSNRRLFILLGAAGCGTLLVIAVLAVACAAMFASNVPAPSSSKSLGVGDDASVRDLSITVDSAETSTGALRKEGTRSKMSLPTESDKLGKDEVFVVVRFTMRNVGNRPADGYENNFGMQDENGYRLEKQYPESIVGTGSEARQGWRGEVAPGQERNGVEVFSAPSSSRAIFLYAPDIGPGSSSTPAWEIAKWDLGLVSDLPRDT